MKWLIALGIVVAAAFVPMTANAQCDGVAVTREDGGVNCFPPVEQNFDSDWTVSPDGNFAMAEGNDEDGNHHGLCVGCRAIVVRSSAPVQLEVQQYANGALTHSYRRTVQPNTGYVTRQTTTTVLVKATALDGGQVDFIPAFWDVR